jgi:hypothetical protein
MSDIVLWGFDGSTYVRTVKMLLSEKDIKRWLRLSEQFPANDKWPSAGFRSFDGAGCWV